jgi:hypothetical protein
MTFFDRLNVAITARDFEGADDIAALAHAQSLCRTHAIKVTQGDRPVGEIAKGTVLA